MISSDDFVDRDKLISTSFYDIIEKIWNHGLQIKQGSCALWSHMILYLRTSKNTGKICWISNYLLVVI